MVSGAPFDQWVPGYVASELRPTAMATWVDRTRRAIDSELPDLTTKHSLNEVLTSAVHDHWVAFLTALSRPDLEFSLVPSAHMLAEQVAARQLPVETLLTIYRAARNETWKYAVETAHRPTDSTLGTADLLIQLWDRASQWIDLSLSASIEVYHGARAQLRRNASARLFDVVRNILHDGSAVDVRIASQELGGYPLSSINTALVLSTSRPGPQSNIRDAAAAIASCLKGSSLVVEPGGTELWVWVATRGRPDHGALESLTKTLHAGAIHVAVGTASAGIGGFALSHREALRAQEIAQRQDPPPALTRFEHVALMSLLGCTPDLDRFVQRTIGPLAGAGAPTARMRETLAAVLEAGSTEVAAQRLRVHRNTVRYRMDQIEALLPPGADDQRAETAIALRHVRLFHPTGLTTPSDLAP